MNETSSGVLKSKTGTIMKGCGPYGMAPILDKTPGTIGICDDLDVTYRSNEQNKNKKKSLIEDTFRNSIEAIDLVVEFIKKPNKTKGEVVLITSTMEQFFKIPNNSGPSRDAAIKSVTDQLMIVLKLIKNKLTSCFNIEIRDVGWFEKYCLWVRVNVLRNTDAGSDLMAQAVGENKMIFYPEFFNRPSIDTVLHEAAHLVGIGNQGKDYYFGEASWNKIKDHQEAREHPDAYSNFVANLAQLVKGRQRRNALTK